MITVAHIDKMNKMITDFAKAHRYELDYIGVEWQVLKLNHPKYDEPYDQPLPYLILAWK